MESKKGRRIREISPEASAVNSVKQETRVVGIMMVMIEVSKAVR